MIAQHRLNVVSRFAGTIDGRIETAFAYARVQHVPEREARLAQRRTSRVVVDIAIESTNLGNDWPKRVLRVRIVLFRSKRCNARHAAENEHARIGAQDRWKGDTQNLRVHPSILQPAVCRANARVTNQAEYCGSVMRPIKSPTPQNECRAFRTRSQPPRSFGRALKTATLSMHEPYRD
jgi:hypothetical protein